MAAAGAVDTGAGFVPAKAVAAPGPRMVRIVSWGLQPPCAARTHTDIPHVRPHALHTHAHKCTRVHLHTHHIHMSINAHTCTPTCTRSQMHACTCTHMFKYTCVHLHVHVHKCARVYNTVHTCVRACCTHTCLYCMHTCAHTPVHTCTTHTLTTHTHTTPHTFERQAGSDGRRSQVTCLGPRHGAASLCQGPEAQGQGTWMESQRSRGAGAPVLPSAEARGPCTRLSVRD